MTAAQKALITRAVVATSGGVRRETAARLTAIALDRHRRAGGRLDGIARRDIIAYAGQKGAWKAGLNMEMRDDPT